MRPLNFMQSMSLGSQNNVLWSVSTSLHISNWVKITENISAFFQDKQNCQMSVARGFTAPRHDFIDYRGSWNKLLLEPSPAPVLRHVLGNQEDFFSYKSSVSFQSYCFPVLVSNLEHVMVMMQTYVRNFGL